MMLESDIVADEFMKDIDSMNAFIDEEVPSQKEDDDWEEAYQVLPDSPYMEAVVDQEYSEKDFDTYDRFVGAEVCLPDKQGRKIMARVTKRVKYNEGDLRGIENPILFEDHSLYVVSFSNGQTEDLTARVTAENMLSQVDPEGHHYQVLNNIGDHYMYGSALKRSDGFIISRMEGWNHELDTVEGSQSLKPC